METFIVKETTSNNKAFKVSAFCSEKWRWIDPSSRIEMIWWGSLRFVEKLLYHQSSQLRTCIFKTSWSLPSLQLWCTELNSKMKLPSILSIKLALSLPGEHKKLSICTSNFAILFCWGVVELPINLFSPGLLMFTVNFRVILLKEYIFLESYFVWVSEI